MAGKKPGVNGRRIPHTPITVDYFQRGTLPPRTLFFLTHAHAGSLVYYNHIYIYIYLLKFFLKFHVCIYIYKT